MTEKFKPRLCLDFDGVLHAYDSGWQGAHIVADGPVPGAMLFLFGAADHFKIAVFSSRSDQPFGIAAMKEWLERHFREYWASDRTRADDILAEIEWPTAKPPAHLTIDDRAVCFEGTWPNIADLQAFKPWNKR